MQRNFRNTMVVFFMLAVALPFVSASYGASTSDGTLSLHIINQSEVDKGIVWSWVPLGDGVYEVTGQFDSVMWGEILAIRAASGGTRNSLTDSFRTKYNLSLTRTEAISQFANITGYPLQDIKNIRHSGMSFNLTTGTIRFNMSGMKEGDIFKWGFGSTYGTFQTTLLTPMSWSTAMGIGWGSEQNVVVNDGTFTGSRAAGNGSNFSNWNYTGKTAPAAGNTILTIDVTVDGKMSSATGTSVFKISLYNGSHWSCENTTGDIGTTEVTERVTGCTDRLWGLTISNYSIVGVNVTCGATGSVNCQLDYVAINYTYLIHSELSVRSNVTTQAVSQNETFSISGNVSCVGDSNAACGPVFLYPRYNLSSTDPDTSLNNSADSSPFFSPLIIGTPNMSKLIAYTNLSISTSEATPRQPYFKSDGSAFYFEGTTGDKVLEFTMSTPYNLSSAVNTRNSSVLVLNPAGLWFNESGTVMYISTPANNNITQYSLVPAWNITNATVISTITLTTSCTGPRSIVINNTGEAFYASCNQNITQYSLSTPWNLSTATFVGRYNHNTMDGSHRGITFSQDGSHLFLYGSGNNRMYTFTMQQHWNVSNISRNDNMNVSFTFDEMWGIFLAKNDTRLYFMGDTLNTIYDYWMNNENNIPYYCGRLLYNQTCATTWKINYTGPIGGNYTFDIFAYGENSTLNLTTGNSTIDVNIYNSTGSGGGSPAVVLNTSRMLVFTGNKQLILTGNQRIVFMNN